MGDDREKRLRPLPKPVYRPPIDTRPAARRSGGGSSPPRHSRRDDGYRNEHAEQRQDQRQDHRQTRRRAIPDDIPPVKRKVKPSAIRASYETVPPGKGLRILKDKYRPYPAKKAVSAKKISAKAPKKVNANVIFWGIAAMVFVVFMAAVFWGLTRKNAFEVFVNDTSVGKVAISKNVTADSVLMAANKKLAEDNGADVRINETIRAQEVHAAKKDLASFADVVNAAVALLSYDVKAAVIYVDGEAKAVLKDEEEAAAVLDRVLAQYRDERLKIISEDFLETVMIAADYVQKERLQNADDVFVVLSSSSDKADVYTIISGDTLEKVAKNYGMTMEELLGANAGLSANSTLSIGQRINITVPSPTLSVRTVAEEVLTEVEEMATERHIVMGEPAGSSKVIQQGSDGQKEVTYHITRINGYKKNTEAVNTVITVPPVPQIEEVGAN